MTDPLSWALDRYFDSWEIERAEKVVTSQGMIAATEYLAHLASESWRGYLGDGGRYDTRGGKISIWPPGRSLSDEPLVITCVEFAKKRLMRLWQPQLL